MKSWKDKGGRIWRDPAVLAVFLIFLFTALAWADSFYLDDAFISLRYASNLAQGHGLVFNPGETPVEGYTNFLWVLILSIPLFMGIDPVIFSISLGILLFGAALFVQYHLAIRVTGEPWAGVSAVLVLGGLHTFRAFATGGLETMLQTFLALLFFWIAVENIEGKKLSSPRLITLSILAGLAFLTRMDSLLLVFPPMAWTAAMILRHGTPGRRSKNFLCLLGPFALLSAAWITFKVFYYGAVVPNTYYLKISVGHHFIKGLFYLHHFFASYFLYAVIPLILVAIFKKPRTVPAAIRLMSLICLLWVFYLVRVGGDFIEYRFMVPVLPFLMTILVWAAWHTTGSFILRGLIVATVLAGSVHHKNTHVAANESLLPESTRQLELHLVDEGEAWISTGKRLQNLFGDIGHEPLTIATTAAGAIPYYSRLRTIDMLGLNDPWIARNGLVMERNAPGHRRVSPVSYLREQGVHLILGHPRIYNATKGSAEYFKKAFNLATFGMAENARQLAPTVRMVEIPILPGKNLVAIYLTEHPFINHLIDTGLIRSYRVEVTVVTENP